MWSSSSLMASFTIRGRDPRSRRQVIVGLLSLAVHPKGFSQALRWSIGQQVTPPPLTLFDGTLVDWGALRGKVIVLEFWAAWCPFCARQNPILDRFYRDHQSRGLDVITVSLDKTKEAALAYMRKGGYAFKAAMANEAWTAIYQQRKGLPQLFVIDRTGKLVMIEIRELMEEDIREITRFL